LFDNRLPSNRQPGCGGRIATGALYPVNSVVRELANLSLVKHLISRSEESRIRQLSFPALPITSFGGRVDEAEKVIEEGRREASQASTAHQH
jgi:hypothetical protein